MKTCTKCKREFENEEKHFHKDKTTKDNLSYKCKECMAKYKKEYRTMNKEKISEQKKKHDKKYRETHKDSISAHKKEYYQNNKEKVKNTIKKYRDNNKEFVAEFRKRYSMKNKDLIVERNKKYYKENIEKIKKYLEINKEAIRNKKKKYDFEHKEDASRRSKLRYRNNTEKISQYNNKYHQENKDYILQRHRKYQKDNPEKFRIYNQTRRVKKLNLPITLSLDQWEIIKQKFNNCCAYCGEMKDLEQEHFIPLSKGGEYSHSNIIPACKSCNSSKSNKYFKDWYPKYKFYNKEREEIILNFLGYKNQKQQLSLII